MLNLQPVDRLEIQVLVDNVTDTLSTTPPFVTRELPCCSARACGSWLAPRCAVPITAFLW